ncbi:MAG: hypothetical protein R3B70_40940, partial [Polyangiaceae bacterium]
MPGTCHWQASLFGAAALFPRIHHGEPQALFVSMPAAGKVAVLDPARLAVTAEIDTGGHPENVGAALRSLNI